MTITRTDGLVFLSFFIIFLYYTFSIAKDIEGMEEHVPAKQYGMGRSLLFIVIGLVGLSLGGKWIVDGAVHMAKSFGMSESLVGLTIVAVGLVGSTRRLGFWQCGGLQHLQYFLSIRDQRCGQTTSFPNEKQP